MFMLRHRFFKEGEKPMFDLAWILAQEDPFRYQLLDRMSMDCRYYLKYGKVQFTRDYTE